MTKTLLRAQLMEARRSLSFEDVYRLSGLIQKRFLAMPLYGDAGQIALYSSFRNEVLTDEVFGRARAGGKAVSFPRIVGDGARKIAFFKVAALGELAAGSYEIREPSASDIEAEPESLELVVVPGVAFDRLGGRLGYGKGYYDMALSRVRCPIVALAYDFQVLGTPIPVEPHDVKVAAIVTETRVIRV
ncbi:MAG: 5-formyltetrahydrofolate cyclo-ligase [Deltaproteobacteria bacterium]|nr:5-formyltetrahydrofolate cyclo-ligase [Deltaproteobacteria bacterium]